MSSFYIDIGVNVIILVKGVGHCTTRSYTLLPAEPALMIPYLNLSFILIMYHIQSEPVNLCFTNPLPIQLLHLHN